MPPIHLLIKPASSSCNLRCRYCFYLDTAQKREIENYGRMELSTLEALVRRTLQKASNSCTFAFQGGEPTLVGLDFYKQLISYVQQYNTKKIPVSYSLQTNGMVIDQEWAEFFARHKFLIGLSLDGPKALHDCNRVLPTGEGSYKNVIHAAQLLQNHKVEFNVLTVVNRQNAGKAQELYQFFKRNQLLYQQYIPCLDPLGVPRGQELYSVSPEQYGMFLTRLFDLWYQDLVRGTPIYIRYFENLVSLLLGYPAEHCGMMGQCSNQYVIEADGSVYPCDFYVLDRYRLGNLVTDSFEEIEAKRDEIGFVSESRYIDKECRNCRWMPLCRGGCRRDREPFIDGKPSLNYFCAGYKKFFESVYPRLEEIARNIARSAR